MKAAIVRTYERVPEYGDFEEPIAKNDEILVTVKAAALSRLVQFTGFRAALQLGWTFPVRAWRRRRGSFAGRAAGLLCLSDCAVWIDGGEDCGAGFGLCVFA